MGLRPLLPNSHPPSVAHPFMNSAGKQEAGRELIDGLLWTCNASTFPKGIHKISSGG